jgi:ATP-binding cassette, subfamily C, bacterial CydD
VARELKRSRAGPIDPRLWRVSAAARRFLVATICCGIVITASTVASAVVLAHVVAGAVAEPANRTLGHWAPALLVLLGLWSVRAVVSGVQARLSQRGAGAAIADLSGVVLRSVTAADPRDLAHRRDDTAAVVTRGLDGLRPYFTAYLPALFLAAILTPAAVVTIFCYDRQAALIVMVALPLIPTFMVLIGLATAERSAAALGATTTLQSRLLDLVAGIPTLRALGRTDGPQRRIAELDAVHRRSTMATLRIAFLSTLVLELLSTLGVALVAVSVGLRLVFGQIDLAVALTALLLAPEVFWPLRRVGVEFHAAQAGRTAADKAFALIDDAPPPPGTRTVAARGTPIRIDDLVVEGRDGPAPNGLTAVLEPGRVTVLTGPNGAGKSTTLQVIASLIRPSAGRVTIGADITEIEPHAWRNQLAWLPQQPVLVAGTIADNLALFGELADAETACADSCFDAVLDELADGARTEVGPGGTGLSLGQRQRLALARVLGSNAPVVLLDEPTAHLDPATEARVLASIVARARRGDTVVVVGHRAPVLAVADRIVELECVHAV